MSCFYHLSFLFFCQDKFFRAVLSAQQNLGEGTEFIVFKHLSFHSLIEVCMFGSCYVLGDVYRVLGCSEEQGLCWFPAKV